MGLKDLENIPSGSYSFLCPRVNVVYLTSFTFGLFINSLSPELINRPCDLGHLQPGIVTCDGNVSNKGNFISLLELQAFISREGNCLFLCLGHNFLVLLLVRV